VKSGNGRRFGGTPKLTRETRVLPKGTAVADRTLQRRARSDAPYLWLVAGVEGLAGFAEAVGEGLRADDGGVDDRLENRPPEQPLESTYP